MNKILLLLGTIVSLLLLLGIVLFIASLFRPEADPIDNTPNPFPTIPPDPSGGGGGGTTTGPGGESRISVRAWEGSTIHVLDFRDDPETVTLPGSPGYYFLVGGDTLDENDLYDIFYDEKYQSFNVTILSEPLGEVRKQAEVLLMQRLGVDEATLCSLRYDLSVIASVNKIYSGKNLGFSFCPGATPL